MSRDNLSRDLAKLLSEGPRLRLAFLFGSTARGTDREGSDLDIAILPEDRDISLADELALQSRLALLAKREVDLVRLDQCTPALRFRIGQEGVPLIGERAALSRFRAHAGIEHAELAPLVRRASELFRKRVRLAEGGVR